MMVHSQNYFVLFDKSLKRHRIVLPELEDYALIMNQLENLADKLETLNDELKNAVENHENKKTKTSKKKVTTFENKIQKLKMKENLLIIDVSKSPGFYVKNKNLSLSVNNILESQGKENKFDGGAAMRLLRIKPHLYLFKERKFQIPNSENILVLGSDGLYEKMNHWFDKTETLISLLWKTESCCMHQIKYIEMCLESWKTARVKNIPYQPFTPKKHRRPINKHR
jgi:hypothetical protein